MAPIKPVVVIVGPTASGKSALAMRVAAAYNGEIIAADSRTLYRGMNIGTAKPTQDEQTRIPHHGLDLIEPDQLYSAAQFKQYATQKVAEIHKRRRLPIIVGGTGLYVDGYVHDYGFGPKATGSLRAELETMSLEALQAKAAELGIDKDQISYKNARHLARAIERGATIVDKKPKSEHILYVGLQVDSQDLSDRIVARVENMFQAGFLDEVAGLAEKYGEDAPGLLAPGYKAVLMHLNNPQEYSLDYTKNLFIQSDKNLAKRQRTWFKRNKDIQWCETPEAAEQIIDAFLS